MIRPARVYWTAFIGLLFNYYDLYLFVYLEKTLSTQFSLSSTASDALQFVGLAGAGLGALCFGWLADVFGRGRTLLTVFGVYVAGLSGLSLAGSYAVLLFFRLLTSLALGAEWGISHTYLWERVDRETRYRFSALLQFALLGGLLAAFARSYLLLAWGWRGLFAASIVPVVVLSLARWRVLAADSARPDSGRTVQKAPEESLVLGLGNSGRSGVHALRENAAAFAVCFGIASMTIASGTINVFYAKDLPQSAVYTTFFWLNVIPGMLLGAGLVRRLGVGRSLAVYALILIALSVWAWFSTWPQRTLAFALVLPVLNGLPFGLMGAFFNEAFGEYRTMLSGSAYNLGRILGGFSPALITLLGLHEGGNYFLFTAALGAGLLALTPRASRLVASR
jgi:fucose permease